MSVAEIAALPFASTPEGAVVVELRREAASAAARQQQLRAEASCVRAQAAQIEDEARRALAGGDGVLARQILGRGLCTLEARERLERELEAARRSLAGLLATLVRTENRALGLRGLPRPR